MSEWAATLGAIAAVLLSLGVIWRYIIPTVKGMWRGGKAIAGAVQDVREFVEEWRETGGFIAIVAKITGLEVQVSGINKELHPNGGSSMRDSITRVEHGMTSLGLRLNEVDAKATALGERQEVLRAADESTARDLRDFLEGDYAETKEANAHLRASLNEVLAIGEDDRGPDQPVV